MTNLDSILKSRDYFADKGPYSQSYGFSSSHVWMWELDHKESWVLKNWYFWTVVLEKTLESSLYCKEIKAANPEGNQSWIFIGRTDAEAPVIWPPDAKNWLIWKAPDAGKDWAPILPTLQGLRAQGEGDDRGWDSWMASLTQWTWVWVNSESWWWTEKPDMLQFIGSQRVGHDWATELNQVILIVTDIFTTFKKLLHIYLMNTQKTNENKTKSWQWIDFIGGGRERRL